MGHGWQRHRGRRCVLKLFTELIKGDGAAPTSLDARIRSFQDIVGAIYGVFVSISDRNQHVRILSLRGSEIAH